MSIKMFNADNGIVIRQLPDSNMIDHVPPAVYRLRENPMSGEIYLIKDRAKFTVPEKCYGTHNRNKAAILKSWKDNQGSTGVILRGIKGAGKSVLAEDLGNSLLKLDIPVIMVDVEVSRTALTVATKMAGSCMVYFDEFGKTFGAAERRDLLTYFSDSSFGKILFVVTSNSKKELDKYMLDRPGRFLYRIDYKSLDPVAISEMLDDHGLSQEMVIMMNAYVNNREVTFDMLRFLAPIAAECANPMEFNHRINILNCPAPVYPKFRVEKVLHNGEPFYGYVKLVTTENRDYTFELVIEGQAKPSHKGKFSLARTGQYQVMSESTISRKIQVFVDNVVLIGEEFYTTDFEPVANSQLKDPALVKESSGEQIKMMPSMNIDVHSSMLDHLMGRRTSGITDEQQSMIEMAKFIVENHKKADVEEKSELDNV